MMRGTPTGELMDVGSNPITIEGRTSERFTSLLKGIRLLGHGRRTLLSAEPMDPRHLFRVLERFGGGGLALVRVEDVSG